MDEYILVVDNLTTGFRSKDKVNPAVDGLSFNLKRGETLVIVGESGSGKSVTALSIMGLIPNPPGVILNGEINYKGTDLLKLNKNQLAEIRGNKISMIFQEPMTSLNPVFTIENQLTEGLKTHLKMSDGDARARALEMLKKVKIPLPEKRLKQYPHHLSGGMRQRVMIAMALSTEPDILIADEPTTALDVTIQAQILNLMKDLRDNMGTSVIFITHDMGVVAEIADKVLVMYSGRAMEYSDVFSLFKEPKHPYTVGLLMSIPRIDEEKVEQLYSIRGQVPAPGEITVGCRFKTRCDEVMEICMQEEPPLFDVDGNQVRCWKYGQRGDENKEDN